MARFYVWSVPHKSVLLLYSRGSHKQICPSFRSTCPLTGRILVGIPQGTVNTDFCIWGPMVDFPRCFLLPQEQNTPELLRPFLSTPLRLLFHEQCRAEHRTLSIISVPCIFMIDEWTESNLLSSQESNSTLMNYLLTCQELAVGSIFHAVHPVHPES